MSRGRHHRHDPRLQAEGTRRRRFPHRHQVELRRRRETRAQVHHVQRRRGRAGHLQGPGHPQRVRRPGDGGHDHRGPGHRRPPRSHLPPCRVRLSEAPSRRGHQATRGQRASGQEHRRHRGLQLQHHGGHGRRRLRLRRRDRPYRVPRRLPRRAPQPASVPRGVRLPQPPVGGQQRRDPGLGALHHPKGVEWFKSFGTENSAGHKLFSISGDCERPGVYEFPFGITMARTAPGSGRRAGQGGADRGSLGPVRSQEGLRAQTGLRGHPHRRLGHRHRPRPGHACPGPQPARLLRGRVVRPMHPLPAGQRASCSKAWRCSRQVPAPRSIWKTSRALANTMQVASKCGLGQTSSVAFMSILEHFGDEIHAR